jgi:hypothetical protein
MLRLLPVVALAYVVTPADAQTAPSGSAGASTAAGGAGGAGAKADAQVGFQRQPQLSIADEVGQADGLIARMEQASTTVRKQLEQARAQRDVVKTLCLNDKLSQIDVATRSARDRKGSLQAAATRNDTELANHEFTILTVLRQRAEQLTAEANQCIGEEAAFAGETKTTTTIDPTLPSSDETQYPVLETPPLPQPPPPTASPSQ